MNKPITRMGTSFKTFLEEVNKTTALFLTPRLTLGGLYSLTINFKAPQEFAIYLVNKGLNLFSTTPLELDIVNQFNQSQLATQCKDWFLKYNKTIVINTVDPASLCLSSSLTTVGFFQKEHQPCVMVGNQELTREFLSDVDEMSFETGIATDDTKTYLNLKHEITDVPRVDASIQFLEELNEYSKYRSPHFLYYLTLWHLFNDQKNYQSTILADDTALVETKIWETLFDFQRDGAIAILNKLEENGGCILADSVGLGKTYTALAVIMAYERLGQNVVVFCPKRLEENWSFFRSTAANNPFRDQSGRSVFRYNLFRHTVLKDGTWQKQDGHNLKYSLIVIDESHNFRNDSGKRYAFLQQYLNQNEKTKVLMLTATPINNRVLDLKNQLKLLWHIPRNLTQGQRYDTFKREIDEVLEFANTAIEKWQDDFTKKRGVNIIPLAKKLPPAYFDLLKKYTIARNVHTIETFYPQFIDKNGRFPEIKKISSSPQFAQGIDIQEIVNSFESLSLVAYCQEEFLKELRETSPLIGMLKIGFLKRFESSIDSARKTLDTLINYMKNEKNRLSQASVHVGFSVSHFDIDDLTDHINDDDDDDLSVSKKASAHFISNIQRERLDELREKIFEDIKKLKLLKEKLEVVSPEQDLKLQDLKSKILEKMQTPTKKVLVFTAYKDTAEYLYDNICTMSDYTVAYLSGTARKVSKGSGSSHAEILCRFAPGAQNVSIAENEQINILIATDCISEGQNLQDCDMVINYDIHWNPVRLTQRNGRINRIGSKHKEISVVNYWPMDSIDDYLNLYTRVTTRQAIGGTITETTVDKETFYQNQLLKEMRDPNQEIGTIEQSREIHIQDINPFISDLLSRQESKNDAELFKHIKKAPLALHAITTSEDTTLPQTGAIFLLRKKFPDLSKKRCENYKLVMLQQSSATNEILTLEGVNNDAQILSTYQTLCFNKKVISNDLEEQFTTLPPQNLKPFLEYALKSENENFDINDYTLATFLLIGDVKKLNKDFLISPSQDAGDMPPIEVLEKGKTPSVVVTQGGVAESIPLQDFVIIAIENSDADKRKEAVEKLAEREEFLALIAINSRYADTRLAAITKIQTPQLLADVAKETSDIEICRNVLMRVSVELRQDIMQTAKALHNLNDNRELRKPFELGLDDIKTITSQNVLFEVVKTHKIASVRYAALEKLSNNETLLKVITEINDSEISKAAIKKINSHSVLEAIAKTIPNKEVAIIAIEKLQDQRILAEIATASNTLEIAQKALFKVTKEKWLRIVAAGAQLQEIQNEASQRLSTREVQKGIALNVKHQEGPLKVVTPHEMTCEDVRHMKGQSTLFAVIKTNPDESVCAVALENLVKKEYLLNVAVSSSMAKIRECAVAKLDDDDSLYQVVKRTSDVKIAIQAIKKIWNQHFLAIIAKREGEIILCQAALARISKLTILQDISINAYYSAIKDEALAKIYRIRSS